MGKFKPTKREYLTKVKRNRDWDDDHDPSEGQKKKLVTKTIRCRRYSDWEGTQGRGTRTVNIKNSYCSEAKDCGTICDYRSKKVRNDDPFRDAISRF